MAKRLGLTFPLVSDPKLEIAAAYGVREGGKDAALPAAFVVDEQGIVRWEKIGDNIPDRASASDLIAALRALAPKKKP